jgi:hypothetical protein
MARCMHVDFLYIENYDLATTLDASNQTEICELHTYNWRVLDVSSSSAVHTIKAVKECAQIMHFDID